MSSRATNSYTLGWAFIKWPIRLNSYWSNAVNLRRYLIIVSQRPTGLEISLTLSGVAKAWTPIHLSHDYESHDTITPYPNILQWINNSQIPPCPSSHQHVETLLNELHSDVVVIPLRQLRTPFHSHSPMIPVKVNPSGWMVATRSLRRLLPVRQISSANVYRLYPFKISYQDSNLPSTSQLQSHSFTSISIHNELLQP